MAYSRLHTASVCKMLRLFSSPSLSQMYLIPFKIVGIEIEMRRMVRRWPFGVGHRSAMADLKWVLIISDLTRLPKSTLGGPRWQIYRLQRLSSGFRDCRAPKLGVLDRSGWLP
jgi:hypothetical protein